MVINKVSTPNTSISVVTSRVIDMQRLKASRSSSNLISWVRLKLKSVYSLVKRMSSNSTKLT